MLMQFQADLLGVPVVRPRTTETTALGAAYLAGIACGVYAGTADVASNWQIERVFEPRLSADEAAARMAHWEKAVAALPAEEA
jgi:glycerol kinase